VRSEKRKNQESLGGRDKEPGRSGQFALTTQVPGGKRDVSFVGRKGSGRKGRGEGVACVAGKGKEKRRGTEVLSRFFLFGKGGGGRYTQLHLD